MGQFLKSWHNEFETKMREKRITLKISQWAIDEVPVLPEKFQREEIKNGYESSDGLLSAEEDLGDDGWVRISGCWRRRGLGVLSFTTTTWVVHRKPEYPKVRFSPFHRTRPRSCTVKRLGYFVVCTCYVFLSYNIIIIILVYNVKWQIIILDFIFFGS